MSALFLACNEDEDPIDITGISFKNGTIQLTEGTTYDLDDYIEVLGSDADQAKFTLNSDDESVVSISGTTFTAAGIGSTLVTATETNSDLSATADVTVIAKEVSVTGVSLDDETADMKVGETLQLNATIAPEDATEQGVTWSVDFPADSKSKANDPSDIATVSDEGLVTAKSAGEVVVSVTTEDGDFAASVEISITNIEVTSVTISPDPIELEGSEELQLAASIEPEDATIQTVTWSLELNSEAFRVGETSADDYAEINEETGVIKGKQACDDCIYAVATADGEVADKVLVTITYVEATEITISPSNVNLEAGETQQMTATITPSNASVEEVTWVVESDDDSPCRINSPAIALPPVTDFVTVDEDGLVTAVAYYYDYYCQLQITAYIDGEATASVPVNIEYVDATSISIDQGDETIELDYGSTITLSATITPDNATDQDITWSVGATPARTNAAYSVSVDSEGVVTTNGTGISRVTVTHTESGETDYVDINVTCDLCK